MGRRIVKSRIGRVDKLDFDLPVKEFAWRRRIEEGKVRHLGEVAEQEKVSLPYVHALINLTCIHPQIIGSILLGTQSRALDKKTLEKMATHILWEEQMRELILLR